MASQNDDDRLSSEIESRLDDIFGEDEKFSENLGTEDHEEEHPLAELKSLVLSIDWEITDAVLDKFLKQIKILKSTFKDDQINLMFLQILGSLGQYIKTNRGKAHPKTFKILNSIFARFDEVVSAEDMPAAEKKEILRAEMKRYKQLREQIARTKSQAVAEKKAPVAAKVKPAAVPQPKKPAVAAAKKPADLPKEDKRMAAGAVAGRKPPEDALASAVAELKKFIRSELKKLRDELKQL